jgi:hypothetical protein
MCTLRCNGRFSLMKIAGGGIIILENCVQGSVWSLTGDLACVTTNPSFQLAKQKIPDYPPGLSNVALQFTHES